MRPLIDYGDVIDGQPLNESFCEKLESVQYNVTLAITGEIQGTSREKLYQKLGLESLKSRRWYKLLSCMFKIMNNKAFDYLRNLIPRRQQTVRTRRNHIPTFFCRTDSFKNYFFPSTLSDWFSLDASIRNSDFIAVFKNKLYYHSFVQFQAMFITYLTLLD